MKALTRSGHEVSRAIDAIGAGVRGAEPQRQAAALAGAAMVSRMESTMKATGPTCEYCRALGHDTTAHTDPREAERMARLALQRGDEGMARHWCAVATALRARAA